MIPFLVLPLMAFHCAAYPAIVNKLEKPIFLSVLYRNGETVSGEIPAGRRAWAPPDAIAIDRIEVRSEGKVLFTLEKEALETMTSGFPAGALVTWEIREEGVRPTVARD